MTSGHLLDTGNIGRAAQLAEARLQGVRWRFWRLFNDIYVSAFETILFMEKAFGPELREHAIRISKERYHLRQETLETGFVSADKLDRK